MWILGSSNYGAQVAAYFGLPYCFAYFFSDGAGAQQALDLYRARFKPSEFLAAPHAAITVWAFAGDTQEEADYFFQSRVIWRLMRDRGRYIALPTPEEAAAYALTDPERAQVARLREQAFSGTAPDVAARLRTLAKQTGIMEMAITTTAYDPAARQKSYHVAAGAGVRSSRRLNRRFEKALQQLRGNMKMDKDRIEGTAKQAKGAVKDVAGKVTGDTKLQAEGKAEKAEGKVQNTVGGLKDKMKE